MNETRSPSLGGLLTPGTGDLGTAPVGREVLRAAGWCARTVGRHVQHVDRMGRRASRAHEARGGPDGVVQVELVHRVRGPPDVCAACWRQKGLARSVFVWRNYLQGKISRKSQWLWQDVQNDTSPRFKVQVLGEWKRNSTNSWILTI